MPTSGRSSAPTAASSFTPSAWNCHPCLACSRQRPRSSAHSPATLVWLAQMAALELHPSSFWQGGRVLVHDDVLATGGTVEAIGSLIEQLGGEVVGVAFIIDLTFLNGRERLAGYDIHSLIEY